MINIPPIIYSAIPNLQIFNLQTHYRILPSVSIGPVGNSPYEKSRFEKVSETFTEIKKYSNDALPGFLIIPNKYSSYNHWLVADPRGFSTVLTSENLATILNTGGIGPGGLIQEKCIWVRNSTETKMTLLPISSPLYETALENSQALENKVKISDINIGDRVLLPTHHEGTYLGVMSLYGPMIMRGTDLYLPQIYLRRGVIEIAPDTFMFKTDLNILSVKEKYTGPKMTRADAVAHVNVAIGAGLASFASSPYIANVNFGVFQHISLASTCADKDLTISLDEIDIVEATKEFRIAGKNSDSARIVLVDRAGGKFLIDYYNGSRYNIIHTNMVDTIGMEEPDSEFFKTIKTNKTMSHQLCTDEHQPTNLDKFVKFYKIVKHVSGETYV